jgi:hypothetical protein
MEDDTLKKLESCGVKSPEEREKDLELEGELWDQVSSDPENAEPHKAYVGHVIRTGLLKEASRRYGPMIEDTEAFSIETRRLARYYQKQIVNLMFMTPTIAPVKGKNPALGYIIAFFAMMAIFLGLIDIHFWYVSVAGLAYLVPYIFMKFKQSREKSEKNQQPGSTSTQL